MLCLLLALAGTGCGSGLVSGGLEAPSGGAAVFAVSSYGAKGDGVADDAPAIQRALTAAATAGGGTVTFPCGEFSLASAPGGAPAARSILYLKGAKAITVQGQLKSGTQTPCSHVFTSLPQKSVFEFEDSAQITFTTLKITALNANYVETYGMDGGSAVRFTGVAGGSITKLEVDGASAGALYLTKGTNGVTVGNNFVHDTFGSAIWEDDCGAANAQNCNPSTPPSNNSYVSNTVTDTAMDGLAAISIDDGNGLSHATIKNNTVSWDRQPPPSNPQAHCIQVNNASFVDVTNNSCNGTPWDGIVITTGSGGKSQSVTIQGNTIQSSGAGSGGGSGIVVYDDPQGLGLTQFTVTYNTISTAADDGIRVYDASGSALVQNGQVQHNTVTLVDQRSPGSRFGIDVEHSAGISVASNTISCNGKCIAVGVNVDASTATTPTLQSNTVTDILGQALLIH